MLKLSTFLVLLMTTSLSAATWQDLPLERLDGSPANLSDYQGKALLVVNTASHCGYTSQYAGLEKLYQKHKDSGLVILGFPCNQFGKQEPGNAEEIGSFCQKNYGVSFPMFAKTDVNGDKTHPLFKHLKTKAPGVLGTEAIKWNFTKFLVSPDGKTIKRYGSSTKPKEIEADILAKLK
jgi:glutathione peroxidase